MRSSDQQRRASNALVDRASRCTNGAETPARKRIGQATSRAIDSALCCPRRLGTSSPITMDSVGNRHHHHRGCHDVAGMSVHAQPLQPLGQRCGKYCLAEYAVQQPDGGNADLNG